MRKIRVYITNKEEHRLAPEDNTESNRIARREFNADGSVSKSDPYYWGNDPTYNMRISKSEQK